jgi:hypothetical protein
MSRLFTFGCSFTNYSWSTWADILAPEFEQFYNWGQNGAGNQYIFNSLIEANQRHQINNSDTVIIVWTNVTREDRYISDRWITLGNVVNTPLFTKEFVAEQVCERGMLIRDLAVIQAADMVLKYLGCRYYFSSVCPMEYPNPYNNARMQHNDVINLYQPVLNKFLPSYIDVLGFEYWHKNVDQRPLSINGKVDYHPTPNEHLLWVDTVLPGWVTKDQTRSIIQQESAHIERRKSGVCKQPRL